MAARKELSGLDVRQTLTKDGVNVPTTGAEILALLLPVDGSGSNLDADTLDGQHAAAFATLAGSTFTGTIDAPTVRVGGVDVWHPGNDGSGSGLDADTLDGDHGSAFAKLVGAAFTGAITVNAAGSFNIEFLTSDVSSHDVGLIIGGARTASSSSDIGFLRFRNDTAAGYDLAGIVGRDPSANDASGNGRLVFQTSAAGVLTDRGYIDTDGSMTLFGALNVQGASVWHANNDGVGSGLDADLLDGEQGSSYVRSNAASAQTINVGGGDFIVTQNLGGVTNTIWWDASSEKLMLGSLASGGGVIEPRAPIVTTQNADFATLRGTTGVGVGGATPDATNKLSVNTTAALFNNDGSDIRLTLNKNALANDASTVYQTGFSTRALVGLLANDDFSFKVSPDGSAFNDAIIIDKDTGSVSLPNTDLTSSSQANSIAAGNTLGLNQQLLAADGQVGKTVLAVGYVYHQGDADGTANMKAQITSLGRGNVVFVYASGADFSAGTILEGPIFLGEGEVYVIENLSTGSIITASEGAYGFSQQRNGNDESPMPLLSLALSFKDTFLYAFRNSQTYRGGAAGSDNEGWIHVVNGPVASTVQLRNAAGSVVQGQSGIELDPWEYLRLYTDGNGEYRLTSTNNIMACINANMDTASPRFYDSRLILPVTNDGITWPRSGFISALYANTIVDYFVNDQAQGQLTVNSGTPVDFDAAQPGGTGASDADYEPRGATRVRAFGLISAYSGADSSGLEASPLCPTSTFTQRIALPLHIRNAGDGGNNGIALASPYVGKARLYEWNAGTGSADLVTVNDPTGSPTTEILLIRRDSSGNEYTANGSFEQNHPASALISPAGGSGGGDPGAYDMLGDYNGGYIEIDVPCTCVFNSEQNENGATDHTFKGTSGAAVVGIHSDDDEQLTYGITPEFIRAEIREDADGILRKRVISNTGVETWEQA